MSVLVVLVLAVMAIVHADSNQALPQVPVQAPVAATVSWFEAINACDLPSINARMAPAKRGIWTCIDPFTHVHCLPESQAASTAAVRCTFDPQNDPRVGNTGDSFWSIYLERSGPGHWLVTDWGQP